MNKTSTPVKRTSIIFNAEKLNCVEASLFESKTDATDAKVNTLGRGSVYMFQYQGLNLVLRHYCRGGLIRHFIKDSYFYTSLANTRMWQEFHLLQALEKLQLPAPKAIAARCVQTLPFSYQGDLITQTIESSQTVAEVLAQAPMRTDLWQALGRLIARYHQHRVYHADLNANNILLANNKDLYLIDFDRGEIRPSSAVPDSPWMRQNLERLLRSFNKLSKKCDKFHFSDTHWQLLMAAYNSGMVVEHP